MARKPERRGTVGDGPTFWLIGLGKTWERGAALTSRLQSFEPGATHAGRQPGRSAIINRELFAQTEVLAARAGVNNGWARKRSSGPTAFARPELDAALEEHNVKYAIRLPANDRGTQRQGLVDPAG